MHLPKEMKEQRPWFSEWLVPVVGMGVLLLALLLVLIVPPDGSPVELPRARFVSSEDREEPGPWLVLHASGELFLNGTAVPAGEAEAVLRADASRLHAQRVGLSADRSAPWSALRDVLLAAAQCDLPVHLKVVTEGGGAGYLHVYPRSEHAKKGPPEGEVRITVVPPKDPAAIRGETDTFYDRWRRFGVSILVLRFEPTGTPDVQAVVSTWECYANYRDNGVYLRAIR